MKKRMLAALLAGSMLLVTCGGTGGQTVSQAPKEEASQSTSVDTEIQSGQKVTMKISMGVTDNHFEAIAAGKMKKYIEEQTGENSTVKVFTGAQTGNNQGVFEGPKLGVAGMLPCGTDIIGNFSKDFGLLSLPYLFDNEKQVEAVVGGGFGQSPLKELENIGYVGPGFGNLGSRYTTNSKHPIDSVEDMKGLKIRTMTAPVYLEVFEALRINPTPMAFSRLFSTLQQGVVDGQENPLMNIYTNKFHEAQKCLALGGHVFTFIAFVASKDWYDKLDPSYQQILNDGIKIATEYTKRSCESEDTLALEKMKEAGVEVVELTPGAEDEFREAVKGASEKYSDEINPDRYKEMLGIVTAVQQMIHRKGLRINEKKEKL